MKIKNVCIAGGGTLGSQVAWQIAFCGFNVIVFDVFEKGIENCKKNHQYYAKHFMAKRSASIEDIEATLARLIYTTDLEYAIKDADILSESIPEDLNIKKQFYLDLAKLAPAKTIFTTNSSTFTPSQYAEETGRPEQFLALHFANGIWDYNVGEVMGHPTTKPEIFDRVVKFAREIGMVPIPIHKEQNGYVLNTLLMALLSSAGDLLVKGIADPETIDKTWMISTGVDVGPFGLMDIIGVETVYNVEKHWGAVTKNKATLARAEFYKKNFIDKGVLGRKTKQGFYKYPNPRYLDPDFLK